ncbi:flagellar hook-length control protein FliK [Candidatus Margulisiibacteriota bacterium]
MFSSLPIKFNDTKVQDLQKSTLNLGYKNKDLTGIYRRQPLANKATPDNSAQRTDSSRPLNAKAGIHANQTRSAHNKLNQMFYVNLRVLPEFQDMLNRIKSGTPSIREVSLEQMLDEITSKAKIIKESERTELLLKLKPGNLGNIIVSIVKEEGVLSINIYAKETTKELLEQSLAELEKNLKASNLNISDLQVSVGGNKKDGSDVEDLEYLGISTIDPIRYNNEQPRVVYIDSLLAGKALGMDYLNLIYSNA